MGKIIPQKVREAMQSGNIAALSEFGRRGGLSAARRNNSQTSFDAPTSAAELDEMYAVFGIDRAKRERPLMDFDANVCITADGDVVPFETYS